MRVLKNRMEEVFSYLRMGYPVNYVANQLKVNHTTILYHRRKWREAEIETVGVSSFPAGSKGRQFPVTGLPPLKIEPVSVITSTEWKSQLHFRTERQMKIARNERQREYRRKCHENSSTYVKLPEQSEVKSFYIAAILKSKLSEDEKQKTIVHYKRCVALGA